MRHKFNIKNNNLTRAGDKCGLVLMLCNSSIRVSFYAQRVQLALLRESMRSNSSKMLLSAIAYINGRGIIPWGSFKTMWTNFCPHTYRGIFPIEQKLSTMAVFLY